MKLVNFMQSMYKHFQVGLRRLFWADDTFRVILQNHKVTKTDGCRVFCVSYILLCFVQMYLILVCRPGAQTFCEYIRIYFVVFLLCLWGRMIVIVVPFCLKLTRNSWQIISFYFLAVVSIEKFYAVIKLIIEKLYDCEHRKTVRLWDLETETGWNFVFVFFFFCKVGQFFIILD